jgi:hypothetical protein
MAPFEVATEQQLATFLANDGVTTIDPDGAAPLFETPTSMVPEDLAFIPSGFSGHVPGPGPGTWP